MRKELEKISEIFIFVFAILLTNRGIWLCLTDFNNPLSFCSYHNAGIELLLYLLISILALWHLSRKGELKIFTNAWKANKLVLFFMGLALISISWSIFPLATLYHLFILLFTTILGAYIGSIFTPKSLLRYFFWWAGVVVTASYVLLVFFPNAAIMGEPHLGSWRGIFWHKNFTGSLMAFANLIFLLYWLTGSRKDIGRTVMCMIGYLLSLVLTFFSQSAAGIVTWFVLNIILIVLLAWSKFKNILTKLHYLIISGFVIVAGIIIGINLNGIFRIINRSASLTGRIPLWNYLLTTWVREQPFFGHGFAAMWQVEQFRKQVTTSQGWSFEITNGHNGFMDILLGLGAIGLALVFALWFVSLFRTGKYLIKMDSREAFFPFLIVIYFLLANLSISFILEFESFHWMLLITALFITTPKLNPKIFPPNDQNSEFQ